MENLPRPRSWHNEHDVPPWSGSQSERRSGAGFAAGSRSSCQSEAADLHSGVQTTHLTRSRSRFPDRSGCIQDSRAFCQSFFPWYNDEHRHSGIGLLTPATVHYGQAENVLRQRQEVLDVAYQRHPERFVRSAPQPPALPSEVWINKPVSTPEPPVLTGTADAVFSEIRMA